MIYSTYMNMKKIGGVILSIFVLSISFSKVDASAPSFSFNPSSGVVNDVNAGFTVDILIDSGGYELSKATAVVKFDPEVLRLRKAMRNNGLFDQWPLEQSSTDNVDGIVMLTGITSEDSGKSYYKSQLDPDVFARLEFDVIDPNSKSTQFTFEYSGLDELFKSSMINSSTPFQNVLLTQPSLATFEINDGAVPETAVDMNTIGIFLGIILILVGGFVRSSNVNLYRYGKGRTVVLND